MLECVTVCMNLNLTVACIHVCTTLTLTLCMRAAVADVPLNVLCLLMKDQRIWLCTENIQKTFRLLFGTFFER